MSHRLLVTVSALVASVALTGCCGGSSPTKTCEKTQKLAEEGKATGFDLNKCVAEFTALKDNDKGKYECQTGCVDKAKAYGDIASCSSSCADSKSGGDTKTASANKEPPQPVDSITPAAIKSSLSSRYRAEYMLLDEKTTSGGDWVANVAIGDKRSVLNTYHVVLSPVSSTKEADGLIEQLKKNTKGATDGRTGSSKALFVSCEFIKYASSKTAQDCPPTNTFDVQEVTNAIVKK